MGYFDDDDYDNSDDFSVEGNYSPDSECCENCIYYDTFTSSCHFYDDVDPHSGQDCPHFWSK